MRRLGVDPALHAHGLWTRGNLI
uniref:Transposase n=1 Tax=Heterorhabditis bacteriophora TaxID=37862 RepID=A0A1I7WB52_HETBA